ncbi:hypothetical protein [Microbacterium sp. G2-8]|uniref:hypothetical protein n=1 Tax=Microbacterium sp. G2-8 TaxID=2842454 RepID=UPI001C894D15|nr:hypothetical protein [Microbacterium sp. G2-8]
MTMIAETEEDREARYVAEHPEISAAVPSWADELEVDLDDPDDVAFMGRRTVGSIEIIASGDHTPEGAALAPDDAFSLWLPAHELHENTGRALAAHARRIAVDLITAAALLDEKAAA